MNSTQVIVKFPAEAKNVTVDFTDVLIGGEAIVSGVIGTPSPTGVTVAGLSFTASSISVNVSSGVDGQSYGVNITVNTDDGHVYVKTLAIVVNADLAVNYQATNQEAFAALVGRLEAGTAALARCAFMFPAGYSGANGTVSWELIDREGVTHASGVAFDYQTVTVPSGVRIEAQAVVNAPSTTRPTLDGQVYQIRWRLTVNGTEQFSFEGLEITGKTTVPEGVEDTVELADGATFHVNIVSQDPWDTVFVEIYHQNTLVVPAVVAVPTQTADGWLYTATMTGLTLPADLEPYNLMWSKSNTSRPGYVEREAGRLFLVNPSLIAATNDMRIMINKSRTSILGSPDILFSVPLLLAYLRRGRDAFNVAYGMFTGFTMINASGGVREYWLKFSEVMALRAQYLAEGEKVFNFSGQAISLDVDRTQYYQTLADNIQQQLDNEAKPIKQNLIKKGINGGDGNVDNPQVMRPGANGTVGITLSPAMNWLKYPGRFYGHKM